jgi:N-acetylneuraminate synthase
VDQWFKAFHKAVEMCGGPNEARRNITDKERRYLDELVRGIYARRDLPEGYFFGSDTFDEDFYLAVPLHKGQLSCREVINGERLTKSITSNEMLTVDHIDGPYNENPALRQLILDRGIAS